MEEILGRLGGLVNNPSLWGAFMVLLHEREDQLRKHLERAEEMKDVYRLQGELRNIRYMMDLREKANGKHG